MLEQQKYIRVTLSSSLRAQYLILRVIHTQSTSPPAVVSAMCRSSPRAEPYLTHALAYTLRSRYPVPDYQKSAVATFFADHDPPYPYYSALAPDAPNPTLPNLTALAGDTGGIYNRIGRGVPDVAANGDNIAVYVAGVFEFSGGTSASTPIFSSIINRIIDERLAAGKGPLGFLNPALYENPWVLNDITNGTNPGCGTKGFSAVKGWDPVTGLGKYYFRCAGKLNKLTADCRNAQLSEDVGDVYESTLSHNDLACVCGRRHSIGM